MKSHRIFRVFWWSCNILLAASLLATVWTGVWEYSVRRYLKGFSDAIIPEASTPQEKAEAILLWMANGPPRWETIQPSQVSSRDPEDTLNYEQLLKVCGSATNAFLNLSRSSGLKARRLLLLSPDRTAKHVVAEVYLNDEWVVVDATYRVMMKDAQGHLLTKRELQNPVLFMEATSRIPNYISSYSYERFAHVRLAALPFQGFHLRWVLDHIFPAWDERLDWSLLLERRSFAYLFVSVNLLILLSLVRILLAWLADHRLAIPRFRLRTNLSRAISAFFAPPEIK